MTKHKDKPVATRELTEEEMAASNEFHKSKSFFDEDLAPWIGVDRTGAPMKMLSFKDGIVKFDCYGVRGDEPLNKILHDEIAGMEHYQDELTAEIKELKSTKPNVPF